MKHIKWHQKKFNKLNVNELYQILHLRQEVFVVEQNCVYLDTDFKDQKSIHIMGYPHENELGAYARIVAPGISYTEVAIGRIITSPKHRGSGLGKKLMQIAIQEVEQVYGKVPIRISAQQYLIRFYNGFGFQQVGEMYLEDDIPHIEMLRV